MTYITNLDAHALNMGLKKIFNDFIDEALHCTYDRGWLLFKIYLYAYISDYVWMWIFYVCIPSLVFLSLKLYVYWLILLLQTCTWGVLEYVVIAHDSWFQWEAHPPTISLFQYMIVLVIMHFNCILAKYYFKFDVLIGVFSMTNTTQYSKHYLLPIVWFHSLRISVVSTL